MLQTMQVNLQISFVSFIVDGITIKIMLESLAAKVMYAGTLVQTFSK